VVCRRTPPWRTPLRRTSFRRIVVKKASKSSQALVNLLKDTIEVAKVVLAPPWRHPLMPDPREGGRDTGVGRSSSI